MKKILTITCIIILIISCFFNVLTFNSSCDVITTFSDSASEKTITFPGGGGTDGSAYFEIPKKATITNASFDVSTVYDASGAYPNIPRIDVGDDGDFEWAFQGTGYGRYGKQNLFSTGFQSLAVTFEENEEFKNQIFFLLPKNATVSSATMKVRGCGAGKVLLVTDGANSYGVNLMKNALINSGNTVTIATETSLPPSWDDPSEFKAIFWVGGVSSNNGPTNSLLNNFINYVKTGGNVFMCGSWIDYTGVYSGSYEIPFFEWALHHTWGNRWGGGGSGIGTSNKYTCQSNTSHPVFNTPHDLPNYWNNLYTGTFWHSPSGTINNGSVIGKVDTTTVNPRYSAIIAWNGHEYNPNYGRTLMVRQPIARSWFNITQGDVLTNFTENLITWFLGAGKAINVTLNIGDNGGIPEFNHTGELNGIETVSDFTGELNSLISTLPIEFTDGYGLQFVKVPINATNDEEGTLLLQGLEIKYNMTAKAILNPHNFNLTTELNELVPDTGEGNMSIPLIIHSTSGGKIKLNNISIEYYVPELSNDRLLLLNGHGPNNICYVDYENYTFMINVTNLAGINDVKNVTFHLGVDSAQIALRWNRAGNSFEEVYDPNELIELDIANCQSNVINPSRWNLRFAVRFNWEYSNESLQRCALNTTNETGSFVFNHFEDVYRIENDLELIGNLEVFAQDQGELLNGGWVHASEPITWSNLTAVYEGTTNIFPYDENFNITITDDDMGAWVNSSSSGEPFLITTLSDPLSDYYDLHSIKIVDIPGSGEDVSNWTFVVKTDNDGPIPPLNIFCRADSQFDPETNIDDDTTIFIVWDLANDNGGSGVLEYAMEFNNPSPVNIKTSGDLAIGVEGTSTFYVRARDKVGNWGTSGSASILIDLTDITFSDLVPSSENWFTRNTIECGIRIKDIAGSGVDECSIQYRYVENGSIDNGKWYDYSGATSSEDVTCKQNITFIEDGTGKKVQWRAKDLAGNGYILSDVINIKIDSKPVNFEGFSIDFENWQKIIDPEIKFFINDTNPFGGESSGVDISSIMYSYSTSGVNNYGPWESINSQGEGNSTLVLVKTAFVEGENNFIRFQAADLAGNLLFSDDYKIKVDISKPVFTEPLPFGDSWSNSERVKCNITIFDELSEVNIETVRYSISTNGIDNYGKWCRVNTKDLEQSTYQSINLSCINIFTEGVDNYIRWQATDTAGNIVISDDYQIQVDITICEFDNPTPDSELWMNSLTVNCGITINDTHGSGIDIDSIEYTVSTGKPDNPGEWINRDIETIDLTNYLEVDAEDEISEAGLILNRSVLAQVRVHFFYEGAYNFIYWRAKDRAGNDYSLAGPYRIKVDLLPVTFSNFKPEPDSMLHEYEQLCQVTVSDAGGSGVDPTSVKYRYSTTGQKEFSNWTDAGLSISRKVDGYDFLVYLKLNPGQLNYLQWCASDNAGNGPYVTDKFNIIINSPPIPIITNPRSDKNYIEKENITLDAQESYDIDAGDSLSYYWVSNISGPIGHHEYFYSKLVPGEHNITLYVSDDYYNNVTTYVNIKVNRLDLDGDGIPNIYDPDIDGDNYPNAEDFFPWDKSEWLDTDFDGLGNNIDDDDDDDGYPDDEDEYPLDETKWKLPVKEYSDDSYLLIMAIIVIIIIVILIIIVYFKRKSKANKLESGQEKDEQDIDDVGESSFNSPTTQQVATAGVNQQIATPQVSAPIYTAQQYLPPPGQYIPPQSLIMPGQPIPSPTYPPGMGPVNLPQPAIPLQQMKTPIKKTKPKRKNKPIT